MINWTPDELKAHLDQGTLVFLKLWKPACGACQLSKPALERIEAADTHGIIFAQINTEDFPEMLEIADTAVLPIFFIFKDKKKLGQFIGFKGIQALSEFVSHHLDQSEA